VITEQAKDTSSTRGMLRTQAESPYFRPWIEEAPRIHEALRASLLAGDFDAVGRHAEKSALCMHASAMAAGICYLTDASWRVLRAVEEVRAGGVSAFATMDAGPHVKVLVRSADSASVGARLRAVPGVLRVLEAAVAGGPTVEGFARP
jgi:diphosphomevalonate decarboxylase